MSTDSPRLYYRGSLHKQIRAFCSTARLGSMSEAAEALFLSQPSISLQIQALEEDLGTQLFERRGRNIQMTREGELLFELARPLAEGMDTLVDRFHQRIEKEVSSGEINIAAGESTILYILPDLVETFQRAHPGIHVHLHNVTGRDGMAMLREDKVDFAVGSMLDVPSDISYRPVYTFAPMLITPQDHPLASRDSLQLQDLSPYGLILPPRRLTTWRMVDEVFQKHGVPYQVALEVGGWEVIKRYVALGFGISIVTAICLQDSDDLAARDMSQFFPRRSYGVVKRRGKWLTPQAQAFLAEMAERSGTRWRDLDSER